MIFRRQHIPWLAVTLGAFASSIAFRFAREAERETVRVEFARRSGIRASVIERALRDHEEALYSLRNLFEYADAVSRPNFDGAAADLLSRHPDIQALEWAERVPGARRAEVEAAVRAEGFPDFQFSDRNHGPVLRRSPDRPEHLPVLFVYPYSGNKAALGFDLTSGITWPDFQRAAADNVLLASGKLPLITDGRSMDWGYLLNLPVYRLPVPAGPAERRAQVRGFVLGVFRIADVVEHALRPFASQDFDLLVIDRQATADRRFLHYHAARPQSPPAEPPSVGEMRADEFYQSATVAFGGRNWELHFRPSPRWLDLQQSNQPLTVLLGGLLGSLALGLVLRGQQRRTAVIEREVAIRTAELHATQRQLREDMRSRFETEQRLQGILEHSPAAIFVKDLAGRYQLCNRGFEQICQRPAAEILGRRDEELFSAEQAAAFRANDALVLAAGHAMEFEEIASSSTGRRTSIVYKFSLRNVAGAVDAICGIASDITARKQAETELQESRRQLTNLVSQLPGAAFRCAFDEQLTSHFVSAGIEPLTGFAPEEFLSGRINFAALTSPADRPNVRLAVGQAVQERRTFEVEYRLRHQSGKEKWVLVRGNPIFANDGSLRFLEGLAIDVSALKEAEVEKLAIERKMLEAQKLESLGVLAGGIAHDFNNILTAVLAHAEMARATLGPTDPVVPHLQQIEQAARRAADLCQQMLAYAGKGRLSVEPVDFSQLVRATASLLEISTAKNCRLDLQLATALPPVLADLTQLRQIVMNLVINAADAIGTRPDGCITVTTFSCHADTAELARALHQPVLPSGPYTGLEVRDNGAGMTPETLQRIFEPFFTTKFSGRGLGLSAVLGIVQSHRGALFVESDVGVGSTFRLLLPAAEATVPTPPVDKAARPQSRQKIAGTFLVVDDEESVRNVTAAVLRMHGATVLEAPDGNEALRLCAETPGPIDLILLDLTMPGISGEETLRRLRMLSRPHRVLVMSGYSEQETAKRCADLGTVGFLHKPFDLDELLDKIRTLMPD